MPDIEKPPVPVTFSKTKHQECMCCGEYTKHECTPYILKSFRGGDNLVRRLVCSECGDWYEEYITAAILRTTVPVKKRYDNMYSEVDLSEALDLIGHKQRFPRKYA